MADLPRQFIGNRPIGPNSPVRMWTAGSHHRTTIFKYLGHGPDVVAGTQLRIFDDHVSITDRIAVGCICPSVR
jgi:hypothetical protein